MTQTVISENMQHELEDFLKGNTSPELVATYLFYVEKKYKLRPVLFPKDKVIYQSKEDAVKYVEQKQQLWHETEIKIGYSNLSVNDQTKKIYICPFTGKVFGDNTHPNPQDAIYDWVSRCPENTERVNGLRVKRFFISEDPEVIKNYAAKTKPKEGITKVVFSSVLSGKLFNSKEAVIEDFKQNYLKSMSLLEVQSQNRYNIEDHFLSFIKSQLDEDKIASFVEAMAGVEKFTSYVNQWLE